MYIDILMSLVIFQYATAVFFYGNPILNAKGISQILKLKLKVKVKVKFTPNLPPILWLQSHAFYVLNLPLMKVSIFESPLRIRYGTRKTTHTLHCAQRSPFEGELHHMHSILLLLSSCFLCAWLIVSWRMTRSPQLPKIYNDFSKKSANCSV